MFFSSALFFQNNPVPNEMVESKFFIRCVILYDILGAIVYLRFYVCVCIFLYFIAQFKCCTLNVQRFAITKPLKPYFTFPFIHLILSYFIHFGSGFSTFLGWFICVCIVFMSFIFKLWLSTLRGN